MCIQHNSNKQKKYKSAIIYLIAISLGIFSGLSDSSNLQSFGILISDVFIKIFKCISLPIIALSIIVTLSNYSNEESMQKIWQRTIFYTITTTIIAASVSCGLYMLINPESVNILGSGVIAPVFSKVNYFDHLINLIPANIFSPFLEHQVMGVLLVGMVIGIAIRSIKEEEARKNLSVAFSKGRMVFL